MIETAHSGHRVHAIEAISPVDAAERFVDLPYPLLLESAGGGRYSFLSADPFLVLRSHGRSVVRIEPTGTVRLHHDPFVALRTLLDRYRVMPVDGLPPFQAGAAGFFGYDLCHHLERVRSDQLDDLSLPELCIGFFDWVIAWDHDAAGAWLVSTGLPESDAARREARADRRADVVLERLMGPIRTPPPWTAAGPVKAPPVPGWPVNGCSGTTSNFSFHGYLAAVQRIRDYIRAGDIFQANLSQRLVRSVEAGAFDLYRRVRRSNPAPFAAYFQIGDAAVVSASPERFLRLDGAAVETAPIKGTSPRSADPAEDGRFARELLASEKDRAENIMIVDLLRNDLAKVCEDDSVRATELCRLETHPTVHHLVSRVVGRLHPGLHAVDLLRAAFPGGSITGAPKIRAMQILAELEPTRRGVYTGAIGYIGFDGAMDTSIAIRTMIVAGRRAHVQVGGGIVLDSDPEREYAETRAKAAGLLRALE